MEEKRKITTNVKKKNMRKVRKINKDGRDFIKEGNTKKSKKGKNNSKAKKIFKIFFFIFLAMMIIGAGIVFGVISGIIGKTEGITDEELKATNLTSFVYDKDGEQVAALYAEENRVGVEYKDIPKSVVDAVVSIEDERFFKHHGVDVKRTAGAVFTFVLNGGKSNFGGSTLTQQLVKNLSQDKEKSWTRKIREWYRAITLEKKLSKEEIFTLYVNLIYFGDGAHGIEVAANNFFGKSIKDVNIAESAILAAQIQSPEATNPYRNDEAKEKLLKRQKLVLNKMLELEKISKEEYDEAVNYKVEFKKGDNHKNENVQNYFVDAVFEDVLKDLQEEKNISKPLAEKLLYTGGYKIYSTMDKNVQNAIEDAYKNPKLFYANKDGSYMQSAMVVIEQSTGDVRGLIGGADEKKGNRQLNRATQLPRQPGSCMKPIGAYGPAFEQGKLSPGAGLDDSPLPKGNWNPGNYYNGFYGYVTARDAIAKSMNLPAIRANKKVDISYAYNFAKNMGLKNLVAADKNVASLSLGGLTKGATVMEMANAYATIANSGVYIEPKLYTKVVDNNGKEVLVNTKSTAKVVMKDSTAYMLTSCLEQVVKTGTAAGYVKVPSMSVAGKTGNTNDDYDQWFCGYTPYYTIACWNGYDKNRTIGRRKIGTYPYTAIKLFNTVANSISKGKKPASFKKPDSVTTAPLCRDSGLVATEACKKDPRGDRTLSDLVAKNSIPTETCNVHKTVKLCKETGKLANEYCEHTEEKSFITRDYDPPILPSDWQYMVPKDKCDKHNEQTKNSDDDEIDIYSNDKIEDLKEKITDKIKDETKKNNTKTKINDLNKKIVNKKVKEDIKTSYNKYKDRYIKYFMNQNI